MRKLSRETWVALALIAWVILQSLIVYGFHGHWYFRVPPVWDSLSYQDYALKWARAVQDGRPWDLSWNQSTPVGFVVSLGLAFLITRFAIWAPALVSCALTWLFLRATYLLLRELKVSRGFALACALIISTLPVFLYQNYLQTRNDYAMGAFLALSAVAFIHAERHRAKWGFVAAGAWAGLAVLFKLSAPGYAVGPVLLYLAGVLGHRTRLKVRFVQCAVFGLGALLVCGWYYLPLFDVIMRYYSYWGAQARMQERQYGLHALWDWYSYYPRVFWNFHLGAPWNFALAAAALVSVVAWWRTRAGRNSAERLSFAWRFMLAAWIWPIVFLTGRRAISQLGDVPYHAFLWASLGAALFAACSKLELRLRARSGAYVIFSLALAGSFALGLRKMNIESPRDARDFAIFEQALREAKDAVDLRSAPAMTLFSHPLYAVDAALWKWQLEGLKKMPPHSSEVYYQVMRSDSPEVVYANLVRVVPFVITAENSAEPFGGENFVPLNELREGLLMRVKSRGDYCPVGEVSLESGQFPLQFWARRDVSEAGGC